MGVFLIILIIVVVAFIVYNQKNKGKISDESLAKEKLTQDSININDDISFHEEFIRIRSLDFYGKYEKSPNGKYIIACSDSYYMDDIKYNGCIVLIYNGKIVFSKELERPNDGKVSNNGTVVVNDWLESNDTIGIFYVFNNLGDMLINQNFKANLANNEISLSGRYGLCSTLSSDFEEHSNKTFLFDILNKEQILVINATSFDIRIDEVSKTIHIDEKNLNIIYSFDGKCLLGMNLQNPKWVDKCSGYDLYHMISKEISEKELDLNSINDYQVYFEHFMKALERIPSNNYKSQIHIKIGDIYFKYNKYEDAKKNYLLAIEYNPKATVKRKIQKIDNL